MTRGRSALTGGILGVTLGILAVLAVPTGALVFLMSAVWNLGDRAIRRLERP